MMRTAACWLATRTARSWDSMRTGCLSWLTNTIPRKIPIMRLRVGASPQRSRAQSWGRGEAIACMMGVHPADSRAVARKLNACRALQAVGTAGRCLAWG